MVTLQSRSTPTQRVVRICGTAMITALCFACVAFASPTTSSTIVNGIKSGTGQLYSIMTAIVVPLAAVCFGWNALKALFGGERGMEQAKKNMLTIVIVLALVWLAPLVVNEISGWFSSSGDGGIFTTT